MTDSPIRLPAGVRDFLPRAAARRRAIAEALLGELERWGYDRIITPAFEYADVLARGLGEDARAAAIRFVEPGTGEVVALRPDITPQIARVAATRLLGEPLRLSYEGSVLRRHKRGQREIIQAGVELIGVPPPDGDAEVLALAAAAFRAACPRLPLTLDVGHAIPAAVALAGVPEPRRVEVREMLGRKDAGALAGAAPRSVRPLLVALAELYGAPADVLRRARRLPWDGRVRAALDELDRILDLAGEQGAGDMRCDLGEVHGFEYYTGVRFAGFVEGIGDAILAGGRYDDLVARYGRPARATGFSADVEAIAQAEQTRGVPEPAAAPTVRVVGGRGRAHRIAAALRRAGARAVVGAEGAADVVLDLTARARARDAAGAARRISPAALRAAEAGKGRALAAELGLTRRT
ncbi:MAG TPA: ATP phosphoribosyltransferase regulatory subunit [Haliangiales bacterium]|nr:ATP phosphoribosyltransferase regulatory subunit [Haliangiales bacterium]